MHKIYRLQQRLSITGTEAAAIFVLSIVLTVGLGVREIQGKTAEPVGELFATVDAAWAERDSMAANDHAGAHQHVDAIVPADSVAIPTSGYADSPPRSRRRSSANSPVRMNLNTADAALLQRLPRIGPALAGRIIAYRQDRGPFTSVNQVVNVRGIGDRTLEKIAEWLYVE